MTSPFRTSIGEQVYLQRYGKGGLSWEEHSERGVRRITQGLMAEKDIRRLVEAHQAMKWMAGGRYQYYWDKEKLFINNCFLFKAAQDTREQWADWMYEATSSLMVGGGIGQDYSVFRPNGALLVSTGGEASGPIPLAKAVDSLGKQVRQGGSRRSAIYGSLNWAHGDIEEWISIKDWDSQPSPVPGYSMGDLKRLDFEFACPLDSTNISVNYDDAWLSLGEEGRCSHPTFRKHVEVALRNGEPGWSFNFGAQQEETARNACTEVVSADNGDMCNLSSLNMSRIETLEEMEELSDLVTRFLLCGTIKGELPLPQMEAVREKNRRLGLGLMGMHEWLLQRGSRYEATPELHKWLKVWQEVSDHAAEDEANIQRVSVPVAVRAIAPTGTIGMVAGTTTGVEPIYATAFRRRWYEGEKQRSEVMRDPTAEAIWKQTGVHPDEMDTALSLASDPQRRLAFQAEVQGYVDQAISSTLNLPAWGSKENNENTVDNFARLISKYAPRLRGMTVYPDGARGGQPIEPVAWDLGDSDHEQALDGCEMTGRGTCEA